MTVARLLAALDLPVDARVERRVPKKLLSEHGAPTAADRRKINEGIEQILWVATLKPGTVGVAEYRDESREYLEIAVLAVTLRAAAKPGRLIELLHRSVPYPVLAVAEQGVRTQLSLAHKRWSQAESGKTVLDGDVIVVDSTTMEGQVSAEFLSALALGCQPRGNLFALYQGWIDTLLALRSAQHTNMFAIPETEERRAARRVALDQCERLAGDIARLRAKAAQEKQLPKQVELNLRVKRLEAERAAALTRL